MAVGPDANYLIQWHIHRHSANTQNVHRNTQPIKKINITVGPRNLQHRMGHSTADQNTYIV